MPKFQTQVNSDVSNEKEINYVGKKSFCALNRRNPDLQIIPRKSKQDREEFETSKAVKPFVLRSFSPC
jgi:hypothetical protein